ncbi:Predicted arabinose efflux permease, MFS family [Agromyces sp. CF514]|uniref:MFS transporter n=1 Tax=Agromyces sp. CF514 TaxID=1881031 RepID=UPI0008EFCC8D|nr:MFS transporter [Agromyces sp. CF514]SFR66308.1 Predicted arabinose efflux permease, MFS family [Agromyces sp. CF514]
MSHQMPTPEHVHHAPGAIPTPPSCERRGLLALVLLCLAQFMLVLDVTIVNIAIPDLSRDLGLDPTSAAWPIAAYAVPYAALLLVGGSLADRFGARRLVLLGLAVFTFASLAAGLSATPETLIAARAAQGIGAAMLSPAALAALVGRFSGPARHRALAAWAAVGGAGGAIGVLLGGLLTAGPGWRWIFLVNVPVGVLVFTLVPLAVAAGARSTRRPMDLGIFRIPAMRFGASSMLVASGLLIGSSFLLSFALQASHGWSALATGFAFLPVALGTVLGAHSAGRLTGRVGPRTVAMIAFGTTTSGFGAAAIGSTVPAVLITAIAVAATGLGAAFVAATTTALPAVEQAHVGFASGVMNVAHELGGAVGVASFASLAAVSLASSSDSSGFAIAFAVASALSVATVFGARRFAPRGIPDAAAPRFVH